MSSVADKLGTGSSFGQRRERSARGRAKAITEGEIPSYELVRLRLDEVSSTPLNPRRNFGTDEEMTRFGEELRHAQLAACVAVTRGAYLALWPEHEARIGGALHVLVNGERRFRSAVHVGLDSLDFVVRDDLASSREQFIKHLLEENLSREDFDVVERARGVEQLVGVCAEQSERGARSRAAEQLGKDRSWVTNQLVLLTLPVEIQTMLSAGTMSERDGRALARRLKDHPGLGAAALLEHLQEAKDEAARVKALEREAVAAAREELLSADNKSHGAPAGAASSARLLSADNKTMVPAQGQPGSPGPGSSVDAGTVLRPPEAEPVEDKPAGGAPAGSGGAVDGSLVGGSDVGGAAGDRSAGQEPEPLLSADNNTAPSGEAGTAGASSGGGGAEAPAGQHDDSADGSQDTQQRRLPYDDASFIAMHLHQKMKSHDFLHCARLMLGILKEEQPEAYAGLALDQQARQPV